MGKTTGISWTDHTFNPWWGCVKVSPACDSCYAETWARRTGFDVWGKNAPRRFFGDRHWQEPEHWNREAKKLGTMRKVFCASMADIAERRKELDPWRLRLWKLIEDTPFLIWLLLTKRPQFLGEMIPLEWRLLGPPNNAWFGVTAENEQQARIRLDHLRRFGNLYGNPMPWVSYEPALGPVDWTPYLDFVKWIIFGGESGFNPRLSREQWLADTLRQCSEGGVAFFNKQAGNLLAREWGCQNKEGKAPAEWPVEFQVQQFPEAKAVVA